MVKTSEQIAIAKSIAATVNSFIIKPSLDTANERAVREATYLAYQLANYPLAEINPKSILRAFSYLGAAYLDAVGHNRMAEESLKGIMPLVEFLKKEK